MPKSFHRLQRLLRRARLLFLFLGAVYLMAGSVLLLPRSSLGPYQRSSSSLSLQPSLRSLPKAPGEGGGYGGVRSRAAPREHWGGEDPSAAQIGPRWLVSRNVEIQHLRHRWFRRHAVKPENPEERGTSRKRAGHKGIYIGCFLNDGKERALGRTVLYDFRKMTSTLCQDTCSENGYQFAGLEYGAECYCGNQISRPRAREEDCSLNCKGQRGSPCGGVGRLSIYKVEEVLPGQKKCEDQICASDKNVRYRGCFRRPGNTTAAFLVHTVQPNITSQHCIETCANKGLPLAVLKRPDCFCGYTSRHFSLHQRAEEQWCQPPNGSGSASHASGGYLRVYQTPVEDFRCKERNFLPEKSRTLVALSSFPGAGNTWLRHLIELATGYYTGSVYFDATLYNKGFKGEKDHWRSGRTACVKTHESGRREIEAFEAAILLIRNPYHCLVAEFNRKCAGHLGHASDQHWRSTEWPEFVGSYAPWWASHVLDWLKFGRRLLVLHFEELQGELVPQLRRVTSFLNVTASEERLLCVEGNRDGLFKRPGPHRRTSDPFTPDMKLLIDGYIHAVDRALRDRNYTGLPQEYRPR